MKDNNKYKVWPRYFILFLFFILCSTLVFSDESFKSWNFWNKDINRTGLQDDYIFNHTYPNTPTCNVSVVGMDFHPVAGDLDGDGDKEFVIYMGNYLRVFDSSCREKASKNTGKSLNGNMQLFDLFSSGKLNIVVPDSSNNISAWEYNGSSLLTKKFSLNGNGTSNIGVVCTNETQGSPTCYWISNGNSVCQANATNYINPGNWQTTCYNINSSFADNFNREIAVSDIDKDGIKELIFPYDADNNLEVGLIVWNTQSNSLDTDFSSDGILDDVLTCGGSSEDSCKAQFLFGPSGRGQIEKMAGPVIFNVDGSGNEEIVLIDFDATCSLNCQNINYNNNMLVLYSNGSTKWTTTIYSYSTLNGAVNPPIYTFPSIIRRGASANAICVEYSGGGSGGSLQQSGIWCFEAANGSVIFSEINPFTLSGNFGEDQLTLVTADVNNTNPSEFNDELIGRTLMRGPSGSVVINYSSLNIQTFFIFDDLTGDNIPDLISTDGGTNKTEVLLSEEQDLSNLNFPIINESFQSWTTWARDTQRTGIQHDYIFNHAYLNLTCNITNEGMNFQPVAGDLDKDNNKEFVLYSENHLRIYDSNCNEKTSKNTSSKLHGNIQLFDLFSSGKLNIIAPTGNNVTVWEYNGSSLNKKLSFDGNGTANTGVVCTNKTLMSPVCYWISNGNSMCQANATNYTNTNNWRVTCYNINNTFTDNFTREIAISDIDKDGVQELIFPYDYDNDLQVGLVAWDTQTNSLDYNFGNGGVLDDLLTCSGAFGGDSTCVTAFKFQTSNTRGQLEKMAGPIIYNIDNSGEEEIIFVDFDASCNQASCDIVSYTNKITVLNSDGTVRWSTVIFDYQSLNAAVNPPDYSFPVIARRGQNDEAICVQYVGGGPSGTAEEHGLYCYQAETGTELLSAQGSNTLPNAFSQGQKILVASDVNNGNASLFFDEIVGRYEMMDSNGVGVNNYTSASLLPYFIFEDITRDGIPEIISTQEGITRVLVSDPTDLEILEIIPIQVVRDVDMVLGKTGLVRVNVRNNGPLSTNAEVTVTFEGNNLSSWPDDTNGKFITSGQNASFDFEFKPTSTGTQIFVANVSVS